MNQNNRRGPPRGNPTGARVLLGAIAGALAGADTSGAVSGAVVAAALRAQLKKPETLERVARAMYEEQEIIPHPWERLPERQRRECIKMARAGVEALATALEPQSVIAHLQGATR